MQPRKIPAPMKNLLINLYCPQITNFALNCRGFIFIFPFAGKLAAIVIFTSQQAKDTEIIFLIICRMNITWF
jgi:hypothetical protein